MIRFAQILLVSSLCLAAIFLIFAFTTFRERWLVKTGELLGFAGAIQMYISGLFERILVTAANKISFPYGPPSYITRIIADNPDRPLYTKLRNTLFANQTTGIWFIICGFLLYFLFS